MGVFTLTGTALSILLACGHPWLVRAVGQHPPRRRARLWMALRFLPSGSGLIASTGFAVAFARYEPRDTSEQTGFVLLLMAASAVLLMSGAAWRVGRAAWNTACCHRLVMRLGEPIQTPAFPLPAWRVPIDFPLAAVSGILRPRLVLSTRILQECPPGELAAVLRHEAAHARRHDNLTRACLLGCPDALGLFTAGRTFIAGWHHAVEEAADEEAAGSDPAARLTLAATLVRVGRMSAGNRPSWMPALALYDGHSLENRVRRLLAGDSDQVHPRHRMALRVAGALMAAAALWVATGPRLLHGFMEWGVRNLP